MRHQSVSDNELKAMLQCLKKLGQLRKRASEWAVAEVQADNSGYCREFLSSQRANAKAKDWRDYIDLPTYLELACEAENRALIWDTAPPIEEEIDLANRGPLERQIVGAIRDCINAHGPITFNLANSAAKRCIGAIKTYNKKVKA